MSFKSDMEKKINHDISTSIKLVNYHLARDMDAEIIASSIPDTAESIYDPLCGTGALLVICRQRGMRITSSDSNNAAVLYTRARLGTETFSNDDIETLLAAKPKHGYLSKLSSSKYPTSYYSRNYIDGLVDAAWHSQKKDFALGVMSGVLMTMCGNFGTFKQTLDPYNFKTIKSLVRRIADTLNADINTYKADTPKAVVMLEDIKHIKRIPTVDVIFIDPPAKDSKYNDRYSTVNSVLMQKPFDMVEIAESDIISKLEAYSKHCKVLIVASDMHCKDHLSNKKYISLRKASVDLWTASDHEMRLYESLDSISDISKYDPFRAHTPSELNKLDEDFRLCEHMYSTLMSGGNTKYTADVIESTAAKILMYLGGYGRKIDMSNKFSQLISTHIRNSVDLYTTEGVIIDDKQDIQNILNRSKKSFIKHVDMSNYIDKTLYLCDKEKSYAIIRIESVDLSHSRYHFKVVRVFNTPRLLRSICSGDIIKTVEFIDTIDFSEVQKNIDIAELNVVELVSLHDDLHSYYNKTLPKQWTPSDVVSIHEMVMTEMACRNVEHIKEDSLDKSSITPTAAMTVQDIINGFDAAFPKMIKVDGIRCITGALAEKLSVSEFDSTLGVNNVEIFDAIDGNLSILDSEHIISVKNTCGTAPSGKYIPLYDAVFTRREKFETLEPSYILNNFKYIQPCIPRLAEMELNEFIALYGSKPLSVEPRLYGFHVIVHLEGDILQVYDKHAHLIDISTELTEQIKSLGANPLMLDAFITSDGHMTVASILRFNSTELAYKVSTDIEHKVFFEMFHDTELIHLNSFKHTDSEEELIAAIDAYAYPVVVKHRNSIYTPNMSNKSWIEFSGMSKSHKPMYHFDTIENVLTFLKEE